MTGKPVGGTRPFGWEDDKLTIRETEAELIREAAQDLLAGTALRTIAARWNEAGVTTSKGLRWEGRTVRQMLRSPRLAGWRIYKGQVARGRDGKQVRGQWEPILDSATHNAVVELLSAPEGRERIPRRGARHYLLTGVLRCGTCNSLMYGNRHTGGKYFYYQCSGQSGHAVGASGLGVDDLVSQVVLARLAREDLERPAPTFTGDGRLNEIDTQIKQLMGQFNSRALSGEVVFPAVAGLEEERAHLRAEQRQVEAISAMPQVSKLTREGWLALDTDRQRMIVESLFDAVMVRPATKRGNRFDAERVDFVWRAAQ